MAKTKISEWSATPANNTDIDSINIAEGCAPSGINDAIRELMSQVKDLYSGTTGDAIAVAGGGTGAVTASAARTNLGVVIGTNVQAYDAQLDTLAAASANRATFVASDQGFGFRNRIINGDMRIDQRNAGALVTSVVNGSYTLDRFIYYHDVGTLNVKQNLNAVTPPAGFANYFGLTVTGTASPAAANYNSLQHLIEGFNIVDLAWGTASASAVTLSFWVRSSVTGTFGGAFLNSAGNYGYGFTYSIPTANTWTLITVTIPGPTAGSWEITNGRGIAVIWDLGNGSNIRSSAGSWQAANVQGVTGAVNLFATSGATFYITGVQLEAGSVASPFERRDYGRELMMCQRYYTHISGNVNIGTACQVSNTSVTGYIPLPVTMRSGTPTVTGVLATTDTFSYNTGATVTGATLTQNGVGISASTANVGAQGRATLFLINGTFIGFQSEL